MRKTHPADRSPSLRWLAGVLIVAASMAGSCSGGSSGGSPGDGEEPSEDAAGSDAGGTCGLLGVACPDGFRCTPLPYQVVDNGIEEYCYSAEEDAVFVPPGDFWMGCNQDKIDDCADGVPRLHVTTPAYVMHQSPVSFADYHRCVDEPDVSRACESEELRGDEPAVVESTPEYPELPVIGVNWFDSRDYCAWLAGETGEPWRLCSEAEWEKAARGGCETLDAQMAGGRSCKEAMRLYPWGDSFPFCDLAWSHLNCDLNHAESSAPPPLRSRPASASPYGMLQAWGTRPQWLQDCFGYFDEEHQPRDGSARTEGCEVQDEYDPDAGKYVDTPYFRRLLHGGGQLCTLDSVGRCELLSEQPFGTDPRGKGGWTFRCCRDFTPPAAERPDPGS